MRLLLSILSLSLLMVGCSSVKLTKKGMTHIESVKHGSSTKGEALTKTSAFFKQKMKYLQDPVKKEDPKTGLLFAEYVDSCKGVENEDGSYFYDVKIKFGNSSAKVKVTMNDLRDEDGYKEEMDPSDLEEYQACAKNAAKNISRSIASEDESAPSLDSKEKETKEGKEAKESEEEEF